MVEWTKGGQIWREDDEVSSVVAPAAEDDVGHAATLGGSSHGWIVSQTLLEACEGASLARKGCDHLGLTAQRRASMVWGFGPEKSHRQWKRRLERVTDSRKRHQKKVTSGGGRRQTVADGVGSYWSDYIAVMRLEIGRTTQFPKKNFTGGQWVLLMSRFRVAFLFRLWIPCWDREKRKALQNPCFNHTMEIGIYRHYVINIKI